jgi:hypothetical protein
MMILLLAIIGFCTGWFLGWLFMSTRKWVDGKQEADSYMRKIYGEDWWKVK